MYIRYKNRLREQLDEAKFKYKPKSVLQYGNTLYVVEQYSQSPFNLSPEISCYMLKRLDGQESKALFKLGRSQTVCGKTYLYRINRGLVESKFKQLAQSF